MSTRENIRLIARAPWNIMGLEDPPTSESTCGSLGGLNKLL